MLEISSLVKDIFSYSLLFGFGLGTFCLSFPGKVMVCRGRTVAGFRREVFWETSRGACLLNDGLMRC